MSLWNWPALKSIPQRNEWRFRCRRAVHGKMDKATTDFRWIGASPGFSVARRELLQRFTPVSQNLPRIPLWWSFEGRWYASFSYASRARDQHNRAGLETQILEWEPHGTPLAVGALALLTHITTLDDKDWFDLSSDPRWAREDYEIELPLVEFTATSHQLERTAQSGLGALSDLPPAQVSSFYANLLAGNGPSLLSGNLQPLSPAALAALLLPAREQECSQWSLAGWEPSRPESWSGIACNSAPQPTSAKPVKKELQDRAQMIAEAILTDTPELANGPGEQVCSLLAFARDPRRRWVDARDLVFSNIRNLSRAESELLESALSEIQSSIFPDYLHDVDDEVREAYHLDMQKKIAVCRAWLLMIAPQEQLGDLMKSHKTSGKITVAEVLQEWARTNPRAGSLLSQVAHP